MNVIFLTMSFLQTISQRGIYTDLVRKFRDEGHQVYVVSPAERRNKLSTQIIESDGVNILLVKTLNLQKTSIVEKGLGQFSIEYLYSRAIRHNFAGITFDLILYSTPPITLCKVVEMLVKKNPQAVKYLLLKDIFPQNAVDIGIIKEGGILHRMFRQKEEKLYKISDYIGCMSPANIQYLLEHNSSISPKIVEIAPNSVELISAVRSGINRNQIRTKYGIPCDKTVFIYGGNLGKPQGIDFLIRCLDANKNRTDCHFVVVGSGTEQYKVKAWYEAAKPANVSCLDYVPKDEYDLLVQSCNVGLIFLDYRFTIPNYPSRLLSYLEYKMPIIAATDRNCDIGSVAEANGYGYWCESVKVEDFTSCVEKILDGDISAMGENGYKFLFDNYQISNTYNSIISHFK